MKFKGRNLVTSIGIVISTFYAKYMTCKKLNLQSNATRMLVFWSRLNISPTRRVQYTYFVPSYGTSRLSLFLLDPHIISSYSKLFPTGVESILIGQNVFEPVGGRSCFLCYNYNKLYKFARAT